MNLINLLIFSLVDMYTFGTVAYAAAAALFIYYTVTSYNSTLNQAFISLTSDAGSCTTVPITTSSSFLAGDLLSLLLRYSPLPFY